MIGNDRDAERAVREELDLIDDTGEGRRVYRWGGTVYKVERNGGHGRSSNEAEHKNAEQFAGFPNVPPTTLYRVGEVTVVAMPYYPCPTDPFPEGTPEILALRTRFGDVINVNTRRDCEGRLWLVDLATLAPTPPDDLAQR